MLGAMNENVSSPTKHLSAAELGRMAQVLKLLAHPKRLRIIDLLETSGEAPVHDLMERLALPQSATSSHLNLMRHVGLVESERRGKEVWYRLGDRRSLAILNCMRTKKGA